MKALNGFLMIQRQMNLKDLCAHIMLKSFIGQVCRTISWLILSIQLDYSL